MNRRITRAAGILALLGLLAAPVPLLAASPGSSAPQRPNILLIISDDIGLDANTDMYPGLIDGLVKQYCRPRRAGHGAQPHRRRQGEGRWRIVR